MPMFFVFALVYTAFMLEGRRVIVVMALELVIYTGLLYYAYTNPAGVVFFPEERGFFISNLLDVWVVGIVLSATMYAQMRLYRNQQRRVDEQNAVLEQANYAKTQFLANTSHEMRTPLTVISVNIQTVQGLLKRVDGLSDDREVQELLQDAQAEIMRLSRMVGGMLSINALAEGTEKTKTDFTAVLNNTGDMMRLLLDKKKNRLSLDLAPDLIVFGNADLLSQVVINLLQNANTHTEAGNIRVEAKDHEGEIRVLVTDEGKGISAQILPHVFERGVSEGGTGVGLFLCKAVVESHGGRIAIESTEGEGTLVTFTIPSYQGQFGGEDHV